MIKYIIKLSAIITFVSSLQAVPLVSSTELEVPLYFKDETPRISTSQKSIPSRIPYIVTGALSGMSFMSIFIIAHVSWDRFCKSGSLVRYQFTNGDMMDTQPKFNRLLTYTLGGMGAFFIIGTSLAIITHHLRKNIKNIRQQIVKKKESLSNVES